MSAVTDLPLHKLTFRQIHLDFHTSEAIEGIGADFDPHHWQETLKEARVDSITCFAKCHHGWSYHPTKVGKQHPHLGFDLLRAQFDSAKKIGVRVPVYLSAGFDNVASAEHPEWRETDKDGRFLGSDKVGFHTLCFNSPYLDYLCDQIREYASHVYLFNSPGTAYINTVCPDCGDVLSSREMYGPMGCRPVTFLDNRTCSCGYKVPLTGMASSSRYEEEGMDGGYRPTRALECIQGIVTCLGVDDPLCAPRLWKLYLSHGKISSIHERIQKIPLYYGLIREVAEIVDKKDSGEELLSVLEEMKNRVTDAVKGMPRPRVLYTMGCRYSH